MRIVTDSTAYLSVEYIEENDIHVVPLAVSLDGTTEEEGAPGTFDSFFARLARSRTFVKTSQPSVGRFVEVFEELLRGGQEIIAVMLSSGVSGTYQSALTAARMVDETRISVIDTKLGVAAVRFLLDNLLGYMQSGWSRLKAVDTLVEDSKRMGFQITVATLDYLARGGRLNQLQAMLGSVLKLRPIIHLNDGALVVREKVRGTQRAIDEMIASGGE